MLAQFVLIVFALFAMLSLVIDVGYARLTQVEMQNAADTAAIEGLRTGNRAAASTLVQRVFDDDLDPTDGDAYQFGAGPIIDLTENDTVSNLHAFETITVRDVPVYKPDLQVNADNAAYGDMVSGRFCYSADPGPSEDPGYADAVVCTESQAGTGEYARNDFNPGSPNSNALLVRMRRSNELQEFDGQTEPDVASSGPSLPFLFGRGTLMFGDDPASPYSPRRDGITVRATAISRIRPALRVGLTQTTPPMAGATTFALTSVCLQSATGAAVTIPVSISPATGIITRLAGGTAIAACPPNTPIGRFVVNPAAIQTVGQLMPAAALATPCPAVASFVGRYAPVFAALNTLAAPNNNRIIGFARVNFTRVATCPFLPGAAFTATIVRTASAVAPSNASAIVSGTPFDGLPAATVTELLCRNDLNDSNAACTAFPGRVNYGPVLAPVLAR